MEGGYQFGHDNNQTVKAGFFTAILNHTWKQVAWQPKLTALYCYTGMCKEPIG